MEINNVFQEDDIRRASLCPLMESEDSQLELCSNILARQMLGQSFMDKVPTLESIRKHFTFLWGASYFKGISEKSWVIPPIKPGSKYWTGIGHGRTISYRIFSLIVNYTVLHPEQPYNLILNGYTIQGQYTLIRKRRGTSVPTVLVLYQKAPIVNKNQNIPPDVISLARYINVKMSSDHKDVQILHYPLLKGKEWTNKHVNELLARKFVGDILRVKALNSSYPVAGNHCKDCTTKQCLEVFSIVR